MSNAADTLLPLSIAARRLRVSVGWLKAEAESGRVPALRTGKTFLVSLEAVEATLLERARHGDQRSDGDTR